MVDEELNGNFNNRGALINSFEEEKNKNSKKAGELAYRIAELHRIRSNLEEADKWFLIAADFFIKASNNIINPEDAAEAAYRAGNILHRYGEYGKSAQLFESAFELVRSINFEKAREYAKKAYGSLIRAGEDSKASRWQFRIGQSMEQYHRYWKQEKHYKKWEQRREETMDFYVERGDIEKAAVMTYSNPKSIDAANKFNAIFERIKDSDPERATEYSYVTGICYLEVKDYNNALKFLNISKKFAKDFVRRCIEVKIAEIEGLSYAENGDFYAASELYKKASEMKEGLAEINYWKKYTVSPSLTALFRITPLDERLDDLKRLKELRKKELDDDFYIKQLKRSYMSGIERFGILLNSEYFYIARSKIYLAGHELKKRPLTTENLRRAFDLFEEGAEFFEQSGSKECAICYRCFAAIGKGKDHRNHLEQLLKYEHIQRHEFVQAIDLIARNLKDVKDLLDYLDTSKQDIPISTIGLAEKIQGLLSAVGDAISEYERLKLEAERRLTGKPLIETIKYALERFKEKLSAFFDEVIYTEFPTGSGQINTLEYRYKFILENKGNKEFKVKLVINSNTPIAPSFLELLIPKGRLEKEICFDLRKELADRIPQKTTIPISFFITLNQVNYKEEILSIPIIRNITIEYTPRGDFSEHKFYLYLRKIENGNKINKFKVASIQLDLKNALEAIPNRNEWHERTCRSCYERSVADSKKKCLINECVLMELKNEKVSKTYEKIIELIDKARNCGAIFICLPEISLNTEIIIKLVKYAKNNKIFITGSYHDLNNMSCTAPLITPFGVAGWQYHLNPSRRSREGINNLENHLYNVYSTQYGNIITPICLDIQTDEIIGLKDIQNKIILNPSYNKDIHGAKEIIEGLLYHFSPSYIVVSNCSEYGGSQILSSRIKRDKDGAEFLEETNAIPKGKEDFVVAEIDWDAKFITRR